MPALASPTVIQRKVTDVLMSRFHDPAGALRPATLSLAGVAIAAVAVVAFAAGPGRAADAPASIPPAPISSAAPPAAQDPTPVPTPVVSAKPPVVDPTEVPGAKPTTVVLDTFDRSIVTVEIKDRTGSIVKAISGKPGDNPSADGLAIRNLDGRTLELTWVDFPIDNELTLFVDETDGNLQLLLIQPPPTGVTDAVGMDRQLILTFDHDVDASSVVGIIQEGQDTPG